jgi:hypothetical protein
MIKWLVCWLIRRYNKKDKLVMFVSGEKKRYCDLLNVEKSRGHIVFMIKEK